MIILRFRNLYFLNITHTTVTVGHIFFDNSSDCVARFDSLTYNSTSRSDIYIYIYKLDITKSMKH